MDKEDIPILEVTKCCSMCTGDPKDKLKHHLRNMGFKDCQISLAIERCGIQSCLGLQDCVCLQTNIYHLVDFVNAHLIDNEEKGLVDSITQRDKVSLNLWNASIKKQLLSEMGYGMTEICHAIDTCGEDSDLEVLVDYIYANYGYKEEIQMLGSSVDINRSQSSCGLDNMKPSPSGMDSEKLVKPFNDIMNTENIDMLFNDWISDTSSESEEDLHSCSAKLDKTQCIEEMDMRWANGASSSNAPKAKNLKRKHTLVEVQELDEDKYESNGDVFDTHSPCLETMKRMRDMRGFTSLGSSIIQGRTINNAMKGPPYFYFENIALMPKAEWETITRFFNGVEPEFVDSVQFSACRRQRGYVHNLPLEGREVVHPKSPMTIQEAFPRKMKYRPYWDTRTKMNCLNTVRSKDTVCREIATTMSKHENDPPLREQKKILGLLKKFNLLWVNPGLVAPLEPVEMEILLGFDEEHTRGASSMTERYKALGNSFQVDTVAYHMTALRSLYSHGIKALSLFSGIGGAEVALHKAGIPLKVVVSVEGNPRRREVLESWWKRTGQAGRLIHKDDVQALNYDVLSSLISEVGGFDLIIGGSPCNNFTGSNRVSRVGLDGEHSRLFFEFPRIYNLVRQLQGVGH